jgi:hypothetical protein
VAPTGQPIEIQDDDPEVTIVSNGILALIARRRAASTQVLLQETGEWLADIYPEQVGEPFSDEFRSTKYQVSVEETPHQATVVYRASSHDFPGINLERRIALGTGREISLAVTLRNEGEKPFSGRIRHSISIGRGGIGLIPLRDRLVEGGWENWVRGNAPLPVDVSEYPEHWVAWANRRTSSGPEIVCGLIFPGARQLAWGMRCAPLVEHDVEGLEPGDAIETPAIRILLAVPSWQEVQNAALGGEPSTLPTRPVHFFHAESPVFATDDTPVFRFHLWRKAPWKGNARVRFPDGRYEQVSSDKWNMDAPMEVRCPAISNAGCGAREVDYELTGLGLERTGKLPIIVPTPNATMTIAQGREGEYDFFTVDNGCIEFRVAPKFGATMYRLSDKCDPEKNLLRTGFPEVGMWTWMNPWFGGVSMEAWLDYRFHRSRFEGDTIRINWAGFDWEGVRVTVELLKQWGSLRAESLFLTRPGIPLVLNLARFLENTGSSRNFEVEFTVCPSPMADEKAPMVSLIEQNGELIKVGKTHEGCFTRGESWVATYDPQTGRTLGSILLRGRVNIFHAGDEGQMIWMETPVRSLPRRTVQVASLYVIADRPEIVPVLAEATVQWDRILSTSDPEPRRANEPLELGAGPREPRKS